MRSIIRNSGDQSTEKDGQICPSEDKPVRPITRINGQRIYFKDLANFAWPQKTEANVAFFAGVDVRTARRWLALDDKNEPPATIMALLMAEIMKRYHQR